MCVRACMCVCARALLPHYIQARKARVRGACKGLPYVIIPSVMNAHSAFAIVGSETHGKLLWSTRPAQ